MLEAETVIFPLLVDLTNMPTPAAPVITPLVVTLVLPVPEFSNRIPSAEPVTALAVTATVVP